MQRNIILLILSMTISMTPPAIANIELLPDIRSAITAEQKNDLRWIDQRLAQRLIGTDRLSFDAVEHRIISLQQQLQRERALNSPDVAKYVHYRIELLDFLKNISVPGVAERQDSVLLLSIAAAMQMTKVMEDLARLLDGAGDALALQQIRSELFRRATSKPVSIPFDQQLGQHETLLWQGLNQGQDALLRLVANGHTMEIYSRPLRFKRLTGNDVLRLPHRDRGLLLSVGRWSADQKLNRRLADLEALGVRLVDPMDKPVVAFDETDAFTTDASSTTASFRLLCTHRMIDFGSYTLTVKGVDQVQFLIEQLSKATGSGSKSP